MDRGRRNYYRHRELGHNAALVTQLEKLTREELLAWCDKQWPVAPLKEHLRLLAVCGVLAA